MEAFEVEPSYGDDPFPQAPRVLWGRVGVLGGALLLFFLLGRITAPGGSTTDVTSLRNTISQQNSTIAQLQASLRAANSSPAPTLPSTDTSPSASPGATPSGSPSSGKGVTSYTVKPGDTPGSIAQAVYGRSSSALAALILNANNVTDPKTLRVGQVLTIPPQSSLGSPTATPTPAGSPSPGASPKK